MSTTPMTGEQKLAANNLLANYGERFVYLAGRWQDEREHEDWADYIEAMKKFLQQGMTFKQAMKKPFGFVVTMGDVEIQFKASVSGSVQWRRIK